MVSSTITRVYLMTWNFVFNRRYLALIYCLLNFFINLSFANEPAEAILFSPADAIHANWVFSGIVANENGENYDYFFQMQRDDHVFHVTVALFDSETKRPIFTEDKTATIDEPNTYNWQVGQAFLRFNSINASWIFGVKQENKTGFNFKVDMLRQVGQGPVVENLRQGIEFIVSQTGQLNGHIKINVESSEQFVTAKNAWFRQIASTAYQTTLLTKNVSRPEKVHQLQGVLCRFDDGSGFYSMNMFETDVERGAVAGGFDASGLPMSISQFIHVNQESNGPWHIRVTSPSLHLILTDSIKQNAVIAGFVSENNKQGFCMLSKDNITEQSQFASVSTAPSEHPTV